AFITRAISTRLTAHRSWAGIFRSPAEVSRLRSVYWSSPPPLRIRQGEPARNRRYTTARRRGIPVEKSLRSRYGSPHCTIRLWLLIISFLTDWELVHVG